MLNYNTVESQQFRYAHLMRSTVPGVLLAAILLTALACLAGEPAPIPNLVRIESNVPVAPPGWAALERRLIDVMSQAALDYTSRYTRSGGTLIWKTRGTASADDLPESFYNFPLLYALGGDDRLRELSFRQWNATARQLTDDFGALHHDFATHADWFHIGEGLLYFYLLPLADPTDHELLFRTRRFAALYMNEDPSAPNYDPDRKLIRSPHTGSLGPEFGDPEKAPPYAWSKGMASYGLPLEDLPGIRTFEDLKDPLKARRMGRAMAERLYRGDVPANLAAAALMAHAYTLTGDSKYAAWVCGYVDAWIARTRANGGITPDNVGLSGKVGEYQGGKWWGGNYGWHWPHGYYNLGVALQVGAASAMLVSAGDPHYLELPRSNMEKLFSLGRTYHGAFLIPYKYGSSGWYSYQPIDRWLPTALWFLSMEDADWRRLERLRTSSTADWHVATGSPFPNRGYAMAPEPRQDCWNCDIEGLADWTRVADVRNKEDRSHEGPWLRFLAGANPDYPAKILRMSYAQVNRRMDQIRRNVLLLEYDPRGTTSIDPAAVDLTKVHEHHWQYVNPVTTEALVQLVLGAPQLMYNGGLLHATLRYFDPARRRPGLPQDVAALVTRIEAARAVVELINLSPFETREVILQAGTFGEHEFTSVRYQTRTDVEPPQPDEFARGDISLAARTAAVNRKFFAVRLPAGTGLTLDMGMRRFANRPSYAFPWHTERDRDR